MLDRMLDHLYSPQMSDILVRLLNFNKSVFMRKDSSISSPDSSADTVTDAKSPPTTQQSFSENAAQEIR